MRSCLSILVIIVALSSSQKTKADAWGADIPILLEILSNAISQLTQLMELVQYGQDSLDLMREINSGINDALGYIETIKAYSDPGTYKNWDNVDRALLGIKELYGNVPQSSEAKIQESSDATTAEAINMNNNLFASANKFDGAGQSIQAHSHSVSPKGAAKLTAQSIGVLVQATSQAVRGQATALKLQAQEAAARNHREKEETRQFVKTTRQLSSSLRSHDVQFKTPRF